MPILDSSTYWGMYVTWEENSSATTMVRKISLEPGKVYFASG